MGCFDGTCAITGMPIWNGDEVFYIAVEHQHQATTYSLLTYLASKVRQMRNPATQRLEIKMTALGLSMPKDYMKIEVAWGLSRYNDYGFVEDSVPGLEGDDLRKAHQEGRICLIHKEAAEEAADFMASADIAPDNPEFSFLMKVVEFCYISRVQLFKDTLVGLQHSDLDEFLAHRHRLAFTVNLLDKKVTQYRQVYMDDDEDDSE